MGAPSLEYHLENPSAGQCSWPWISCEACPDCSSGKYKELFIFTLPLANFPSLFNWLFCLTSLLCFVDENFWLSRVSPTFIQRSLAPKESQPLPTGSNFKMNVADVLKLFSLLLVSWSIYHGLLQTIEFYESAMTSRQNTLITPIMIFFRDIKTKNILVKRDGSCAIADFGLAVR